LPTKSKLPPVEREYKKDVPPRKMEVVNLGTTYAFLADNSHSMVGERDLMLEDIAKENAKRTGDNIKVINIKNEHAGGGDQIEQHVETLLKTLEEMPVQVRTMDVVMFTDEPQEDEGHGMGARETKRKMKEVLKLAKQKNVQVKFVLFNPDETVGGKKEVILDESNSDNVLTMPSEGGSRKERKIAWYNAL
ncbi:MAG: hypothetical protein AAB438_03815, partial [Patescibacteria group bacterium]